MTSKPVAQLLVDLGVARSHSRPHVSNDNPYSEAAFKTLKYARASPNGSVRWPTPARSGRGFFDYSNHEHRHSGIGLHTPASVHFGTASEVRAQRQQTLNAAYAAHPERFGNRRPQPPKLPHHRLDQPAHTAGPHTDRVTRRVSTSVTPSGSRLRVGRPSHRMEQAGHVVGTRPVTPDS